MNIEIAGSMFPLISSLFPWEWRSVSELNSLNICDQSLFVAHYFAAEVLL
jgi:hypothetical protein